MARKSKSRKGKKAPVRPNGTTFKIFLIGLVAAGLVWFFFVRPSASAASDAVAESDAAAAALAELESEIESFRSGTSYSTAEIADATGPAERLLPSAGGSTGDAGSALAQVQRLASASGVELNSLKFENSYETAEGGAKRADATVQVTGSPAAIIGWLNELRAFPQLLTVSASEITLDSGTGKVTMPMTVSVWATADPPFEK
jgi:hypothetical protein